MSSAQTYSSPEAHAETIARALGFGLEKFSGGEWKCFCPIHESAGDGNPSLGVAVKGGKVVFHCNGHGCPQDALLAALKSRGLSPDRPERRRLTLAEFAEHKKLPPEFLKANDVVEGESHHQPCVCFRYRNEDGSLNVRYRKRVALKGKKRDFWDTEGKGRPILAYGLNRLENARKAGYLVLVEGESDTLSLWLHEIPALGLPGSGMVNRLLAVPLIIAIPRLVISQEPGDAGTQFRADSIARLNAFRWSGQVSIIDWSRTPYKDPSELHCAFPDHGAFLAKLKELVAAGEKIDLKANVPAPIIDAKAYLPDTTAAAWDAIAKFNDTLPIPRLYRHAGGIVRVEQVKGLPVLRRLDEPLLRAEAVRAAVWLKNKIDPATPSGFQIQDMFALEAPPLPELRRLTSAPIFLPDNTLLNVPGFRDGVLYQPPAGLIVPAVSPKPTDEEVINAYNIIALMLSEFPWAHEHADRAHAIALLLLPFVRELICGSTPIHAVGGPQPGIGKGLLIESALSPGLGRNYAHLGPLPKETPEFRKAVCTALKEGAEALVWDNIKFTIDSAELSMLVTAPFFTERILGGNSWLRVDPLQTIFVITGNNLSYSREVQRRTIRIRIVARTSNPEDREFKQPDLPGWVKENRGNLIWAALTLAQNWIAKDSPKPGVKPLGSFEDWTRVVGGILRRPASKVSWPFAPPVKCRPATTRPRRGPRSPRSGG